MSRGRLSIWASLRPDVYLRRPSSTLPFPLEEQNCRTYQFARHGLWNGLGSLELEPGDEVLVPAYHHGSEVEALSRAGIRCRFFDAADDLAPDRSSLESLIGPRTRALYLIHHLGFPQDAPHWRRWCEEHGLLLIEDVAMAWLASIEGRPLGSWGDLSIYSPWKTYGLPDLGAMLCERPPEPVSAQGRPSVASILRHHAVWVGGRSRLVASARRLRTAPMPFSPEVAFAVGDARCGPSAASRYMLRRLCSIDAAGARRANYRRLLEALGEHVPAPFRAVPEGACPFAFPVWTEDKPGLLGELESRGIAGLDIWSVSHPSLPVEDFPRAAERRERVVGLPVHQELLSSDLERIADAASAFFSKGTKTRPPRSGQVPSAASVGEA